MSNVGALIVEPFDRAQHDRSQFDCGNETLNDYLKRRVSQEIGRRVAAVFVLRDRDNQAVIGFYTLSSASLDIGALPKKQSKGIRYPQVPVTLLGRMAVDVSHQRKGLGKRLLLSAFARSLQGAEAVASTGVLVDAKSEEAARFYRHLGMLDLGDRRYFMPMKDIALGMKMATE